MVIKGKHLKTVAFSAPWCMKKGKGGLCQKINIHDSVNKLQYFPKNSLGGWKQPHQFCAALFFDSNASLCGVSYKYQPTSVRSNMPTYALKHPGVSCGSPLLSPGHRVLLGGTWHGKLFVGQEKYASVPQKSQIKDYSSHCQNVFVYFCTEGDWNWLCMSLVTGEQTTFKLLFWCFKADSQHFCSVHGNY